MKVLITGIAGFIGSHVAERFSGGWDVYGIDDLSSGKISNTHLPFRTDDITSGVRIYKVVEEYRPNIIIHLAAQPSLIRSREEPLFDLNTNIIGTVKVLHAAKVYGVERIVFASTSAVYHPGLELPILEDDDLCPDSNYGTSKLAAEFYIRNSGIPYTILRFGNVYGPRQVPLGENQLVPRLLAHIYQGKPFSVYGTGEQLRDYVYVKDVAKAVHLVAVAGISGIYNVSSGVGTSTNEMVQTVLDEAHVGLVNVPHSEARDARNIILSNKRIEKVWRPETSLREGIRETIKEWPK